MKWLLGLAAGTIGFALGWVCHENAPVITWGPIILDPTGSDTQHVAGETEPTPSATVEHAP